MIHTRDLESIEDEVQGDDKLRSIVQGLLLDPQFKIGYQLNRGWLYYKNWLVLPATSGLIPKFLREFHSSAMGGYSRFFRTYKRLAAVLFWEGMKSDIQRMVVECEICQRVEYDAFKSPGLLQPLPIPE